MKYCSQCGAEVVFGEIPGESLPRYHCPACGAIHYQNPNMIVGTLPRRQDQVLLCRRAIEPRKDYWTLPAGFLEFGENVEEGALRETREEANADVELVRLFAVYSLRKVGQVYLMFLADLRTLDFHPGEESTDVRLFSREQIPWDRIAFSAIRFTLESYFQDPGAENGAVHLGSHAWK